MPLRDDYSKWIQSEPEYRTQNPSVLTGVLSELPPDVEPSYPQDNSPEKALEDFDGYYAYHNEPDTQREYASRIKGRLFQDNSRPVDLADVEEEEPEDPVVARELGFMESLWKPFLTSMFYNAGSFFKTATAYTPDEREQVFKDGVFKNEKKEWKYDEALRNVGNNLAEIPNDQMRADVALTMADKKWINQQGKPWYDLDMGELPDTIRTWTSVVSHQLGLQLYSQLFGKAGGAAAGAILTFAAGGWADPTPAEEAAGAFVGYFAGSTFAMTSIETAHALDQMEQYGVPRKIAEKYARSYGIGSGAVESIQQMAYGGKLGIQKVVGKAKGAATVAATSKVKGYLTRKLMKKMGAMSTEGLEEVTQGELLHNHLKKAFEEAKEQDPNWKPKHPLVERTMGDRGEEFAIGSVVGAFFEGGRAVPRLAYGIASDQALEDTAKVMNKVRGSGRVMRNKDADAITKSVINAFDHPEQNKRRLGKRSEPAKGSLLSRAIQTGDNSYVMYADLKQQYETEKEDVGEDYAFNQLKTRLLKIQGKLAAENEADYKVLEELEKENKIHRETVSGITTLYASSDVMELETEDGIPLADRYGITEKVYSVDSLKADSFELTDEQLQDEDFLQAMFPNAKDSSRLGVRKMTRVLKEFKKNGGRIIKNQNRVAVLTEEQLEDAGIDSRKAAFSKKENGIRRYYVFPSAISSVEAKPSTLTLKTEGKKIEEEALPLPETQEEVTGEAKAKPKATPKAKPETLEQEAQKYDSAEAFVDAQTEDVLFNAEYYQDEGARELAHKAKDGDASAIAEMASAMSKNVSKDSVLIPVPSRSGKATITKQLAVEIARQTGATVSDLLEGTSRESLYEQKKAGQDVSAMDLGFKLKGKIPEGKNVLLVDNVMGTGKTFTEAKKIIPNAKLLVHSVDSSQLTDIWNEAQKAEVVEETAQPEGKPAFTDLNLKPDAKVLTIDSLEKAKGILGSVHPDKMVENLIEYATAKYAPPSRRYDVLRIKRTGEGSWKEVRADKADVVDKYEELTGSSNPDQYVVLNEDAVLPGRTPRLKITDKSISEEKVAPEPQTPEAISEPAKPKQVAVPETGQVAPTLYLSSNETQKSVTESMLALYMDPEASKRMFGAENYADVQHALKMIQDLASEKATEIRHNLKQLVTDDVENILNEIQTADTVSDRIKNVLASEVQNMTVEIQEYIRKEAGDIEQDRVSAGSAKIMNMSVETVKDAQLKINSIHDLLYSIGRLPVEIEAQRMLSLSDEQLVAKAFMTDQLGYDNNFSQAIQKFMTTDVNMGVAVAKLLGHRMWHEIATNEGNVYFSQKAQNVDPRAFDELMEDEQDEYADLKEKYPTKEARAKRLREIEVEMNSLPIEVKLSDHGIVLGKEHADLKALQEREAGISQETINDALLTPREYFDKKGSVDGAANFIFDEHARLIRDAMIRGEAVNKESVDNYNIKMPVGWEVSGQNYIPKNPDIVRQEQMHAITMANMDELAQSEIVPTFGTAELGAMGLQSEFVKISRRKKQEIHKVQTKILQWKKRVPDIVLEAIPFAIEGTEWTAMAEVGKEHSVAQIMEDPEAQAVLQEAKDLYEELRQELNQYMDELTHDEFIKFFKNYVSHFYTAKSIKAVKKRLGDKYKTHSPSEKNRVFETMKDAEEFGYEIQEGLTIDKIIAAYAKMNWTVATNRKSLNNITQLESADGDMMVIPVYSDKDTARKNLTDREVQGALRTMSKKMAGARLGGRLSSKVLGDVADLVDKFKGREAGYKWMDSPYKDYAGFWVHPDAENVMKKMIGEQWDNWFVKGWMTFVQWSKFAALAFSMFHQFSLSESFSSAAGYKDAAKAFLIRKGFPKDMQDSDVFILQNTMDKLMDDPDFGGFWIGHGLQVSLENPDINNSLIDQQAQSVIDWGKESRMPWSKAIGKTMQGIQNYKKFVDKNLWQYWHPAMKLHTAQKILQQYEEVAESKGEEINRELVAEEIAQYVNNAFGGQEWEAYEFITPKVRQFLSMQVFAPDWTMSNLQIAGLPIILDSIGIKGLSQRKGSKELQQMATRYWPRMLFTITVFPAIVQACIYGMTAPFREPEDDDELWSFNNEFGQEFSVDLTPIHKAMSRSEIPLISDYADNLLGASGKQRHYLRWGKQAREVKRWVEHPLEAFYSKSSMAVKVAFEQITGTSNLDGWETPWQREDLNFAESMPARTASMAKKFVPLSVKTLAQGRPSTFFAPTGKGMSPYKARKALTQVFDAYASPTLWDQLEGHPDYVQNLDKLAPHILDAAEKNGLDKQTIVDSAKRSVTGRHYRKFWNALEKDDTEELEKIAEGLIRLHAVTRYIHQSMERRYKERGAYYQTEKRHQVQSAYRKSVSEMEFPKDLSEESKENLKQLERIFGGTIYGKRYLRSIYERFTSGDNRSQ